MVAKYLKTEKALSKFGDTVVRAAKINLQQSKASGSLSESLSYDLDTTRRGKNISSFHLSFQMREYGLYIDEGRGPTKGGGNGQVRKNLEKWIKDKKIRLRGADGKFQKTDEKGVKNLAFLIARKIHKEGFKGNKFFTKAVKSKFGKLNKELGQAFALDMEKIIASGFK